MGLYLGLSPVHARSVALVLNVTTAQDLRHHNCFHCKFNNLFETTDHIDEVIKWQQEAYFTPDPTLDQVQQPPRKPSVRIMSPDIALLPPHQRPLC